MATSQNVGDISGESKSLTADVVMALLNERDVRYAERFESQIRALDLAFQAKRDLTLERLEAIKSYTAQQFDASQKAIEKSERAIELRFESVNEFRAQLADQNANTVSRATFEAYRDGMLERMDSLSKRLTVMESRQIGANETKGDTRALIAMVIAAVAVVVAIVVPLLSRP